MGLFKCSFSLLPKLKAEKKSDLKFIDILLIDHYAGHLNWVWNGKFSWKHLQRMQFLELQKFHRISRTLNFEIES